MKIKHYQGTLATLQTQWQHRDTIETIIKKRKTAERDARLVKILTR